MRRQAAGQSLPCLVAALLTIWLTSASAHRALLQTPALVTTVGTAAAPSGAAAAPKTSTTPVTATPPTTATRTNVTLTKAVNTFALRNTGSQYDSLYVVEATPGQVLAQGVNSSCAGECGHVLWLSRGALLGRH